MNNETYRRLPGKKKGFFGLQTLWQGSDHLLLINSVRMREDYRRFYFKDIQSIIVRKTKSGAVINAAAGFICAFFICFAWMLPDAAPFFWVMAGMILLMLLFNMLWLGPTCECQIRTPVQTEKLPPLNRVKTAMKTLDRVIPLIEQIQGPLDPEQIGTDRSEAKPAAASPPPLDTPAASESGTVHTVLFCSLLGIGVISIADFYINHIVLTLLLTILAPCALLCAAIAIARGSGRKGGGVKILAWASAVCIVIDFGISYFYQMYISIKNINVDAMYNQWEMMKFISQMSPDGDPVLTGIYLYTIGYGLICGAAGLVLLEMNKGGRKK